ncbi:MAG: biopolymer transporter ExbD [bacterium]
MHGSHGSSDESIAHINIIPLVDVVLVLLIIFMVTAVFQMDAAMKVNLPKGSTQTAAAGTPPKEITVKINKEKVITVNGNAVKIETIATTVKNIYDKNNHSFVVLRGSPKVRYGDVVPVLDELSSIDLPVSLALAEN